MLAKPRGQYARSVNRVRSVKSLNSPASTSVNKPHADLNGDVVPDAHHNNVDVAEHMDVSDNNRESPAQIANSVIAPSPVMQQPIATVVSVPLPPLAVLSQSEMTSIDGAPSTAALVNSMFSEVETILVNVQRDFLLQLTSKDSEVTSLRIALQNKYQDDMRIHDRQLVDLMTKNNHLERELIILKENNK